MKCPYTYPHRSRVAMIDYLLSHKSYSGWNHPRGAWSPFAWNVKVHGTLDLSGRSGEYPVLPDLDHAWQTYVDSDQNYSVWERAIDDARRNAGLEDHEYTTWPGDDQGDWQFTFAGRSGGWLILAKWEPEAWDFTKCNRDDFADELSALPWPTLRKLYKAIRCMDQDFTPRKVTEAVNAAINYIRHDWEESRQEPPSLHRDQVLTVIAVYDNGGETIDRYSIYFADVEKPGFHLCLGVSENANAFSQWTAGQLGSHNGQKITFAQLPPVIQAHVWERATIA